MSINELLLSWELLVLVRAGYGLAGEGTLMYTGTGPDSQHGPAGIQCPAQSPAQTQTFPYSTGRGWHYRGMARGRKTQHTS